MRYNDCIDCNNPIGEHETRCSDCNQKHIKELKQKLNERSYDYELLHEFCNKLKLENEELRKNNELITREFMTTNIKLGETIQYLNQVKQRVDEEFTWWVNHGMEGQYDKSSILSLLTKIRDGKK